MNSLLTISVSAAFGLILISHLASAQYPGGTGTTGPTDGSGRGTGSAGVQTGGGPETTQSPGVNQPYNIFGPQPSVTTTTAASGSESSKTQSQKPRKKSKKTAKQSRKSADAAASPTASPSPR